MTNVSQRALRILLVILGLDATAKGLLMIFGGKALMMRLFPHPPESEITTLLLLVKRESGALDLAVALMLYFAYRDPARNVAILNAIAVGLCIAAFSSVVSLYTLDASRLYPAYAVCVWWWRRYFSTFVRTRPPLHEPRNSAFQIETLPALLSG